MPNKFTLTLSEFLAALPYLTMAEHNQAMAKDYMVLGLRLSVVASKYQCSSQNVVSTAKRVLKAHQEQLAAQQRLKS